MKNKGFRIGLVVALLLLTGYYLWPTLSLYLQTRDAPPAGTPAYRTWETANAERVEDTRESALKLGLDLRGGMSTTLEVRVDELIRALATDTDAA
ncbi:MAG TPA: protein translocase subunit SecD, partial [Rhodothermales bacterium]|nr:protein translocase subunit SecD [Rhodothermales bacterium]